ncbi:Holliday junction resolvase RuvX [Desulfonatronovibrio hydrogenovorans]|uniref:Holliday junction resolvase RuvX n=1 Tax=Desulfonatronovibrio hydrogenovorans TaxID=53245 RepID=UPI00048ADC2D|nr:Holliday junction resolvase RuvX [Desulfonatronovibrio hydrogenovorans]
MRYLGIDFGLKRIGLAVSSPCQSMVFPLATIVRTTRQDTFDQLMDIIEKQNIQAVVLGLPIQADQEPSLTCRQAINFKESLCRRTDLPVYTVNEAFTSGEAKSMLLERKLSQTKVRENLDQMAAVLILETFLNQTS